MGDEDVASQSGVDEPLERGGVVTREDQIAGVEGGLARPEQGDDGERENESVVDGECGDEQTESDDGRESDVE